jgi:hypothetical protein
MTSDAINAVHAAFTSITSTPIFAGIASETLLPLLTDKASGALFPWKARSTVYSRGTCFSTWTFEAANAWGAYCATRARGSIFTGSARLPREAHSTIWPTTSRRSHFLVQLCNLINEVVLERPCAINDFVEALNILGNDWGIPRVLVSGRRVKPGVADLVSNGRNLVKDSPHHSVICSIVRVGVVRGAEP